MIWLIALASGALIATLICMNDMRALLWVACGVASFAATAAWQALGLPYHSVACGLVDALQCLLIYHLGRFRWELALWRVWQASLLISIVRFFGGIHSLNIYVAALESCNWIALAVICSSRLSRQFVDGLASHWYGLGGYLSRALLSLRLERQAPPWHLRGVW